MELKLCLPRATHIFDSRYFVIHIIVSTEPGVGQDKKKFLVN